MTTGSEPITRNAVIDATTRVVARRADHRIRWPAIAHEAGNEQAVLAASWFEDDHALIEECYARSAQAFAEALLRGETALGIDLKIQQGSGDGGSGAKREQQHEQARAIRGKQPPDDAPEHGAVGRAPVWHHSPRRIGAGS